MLAQNINYNSVSLLKRYFSKLFSNSLNFLANFIAISIVPRTLGPVDYGSFIFLKRSFQSIVAFFDFGAETAYFTKISKSDEIKKITFFYLLFSVSAGIVLLAVIYFIMLVRKLNFFWPEQKAVFVFAAAFLTLIIAYVARLTTLADGREITIGVELRRAAWVIIFNAILLVLYFTDKLNLANYFIFQIISYSFLLMLIGSFIKKKGVYDFGFIPLNIADTRELLKYFYRYCHPLFTAVLIGFVCMFFDPWFLQRIGGSVEQGMYGLAYNLGALCFLFTGSVTPIFMQSFAKAHGQGDLERMRQLFNRIIFFYFLTACFVIFFFFHVRELIVLFGGKAFLKAELPLKIMIFYPLHQVFGQLSDGSILVMEKTKINRNVGILMSVTGIIITYLLLAPKTYLVPGLQLAATGLSIKMVLVQFIGVNITLFFVTRFIKVGYLKFLLYQLFILLPLLAIGGIIFYFEQLFFKSLESPAGLIWRFLFSGSIYLACVMGLCWFSPAVIGSTKKEITLYLSRIGQRLFRGF